MFVIRHHNCDGHVNASGSRLDFNDLRGDAEPSLFPR